MNAADPESIAMSARIIRRGGLVAFPTETVYGLGADAENPLAVAGIFDVKGRPRIDPIIVHVSGIEMAERYGHVPKEAVPLVERFWPGPLTLVIPRKSAVPSIVTAGLDTVGIRVPAHPCALDLIRACGRGIAAPSANLFGYVSPTEAAHVVRQLSDKVDGILDGGACVVGLESTIVSFSGDTPAILRPGGTPKEELERLLGPLKVRSGPSAFPDAPGQLERHYATRTPLYICDEGNEDFKASERAGLLTLSRPDTSGRYEIVEILSPSANMREAAANLFRCLHRLDGMNLDRIVARPIPPEGLGLAIMDRLQRCAVWGLERRRPTESG
jgi:L-threonylcarbamoyladenylate synthase